MNVIERIEMGFQQVAPDQANWVTNRLQENGPWTKKETLRDKVNCLLRFHLANSYQNTLDVRGYLTDKDDDDTWAEAVTTKVVPVITQYCC